MDRKEFLKNSLLATGTILLPSSVWALDKNLNGNTGFSYTYPFVPIWCAGDDYSEAISLDNDNKDYFINLDSKSGRFTGFVGCNTIMGRYTMIDATKLQFSNVGSTKMSCPDTTIESKFLKMIEKVENYKIEGANLYFNKRNSSDVLKFEAVK